MNWRKLAGVRTLMLVGLAALFAVSTARAQTPEGTTIWNKATLTFTDANNNTYSAVEDSVSVTVGFAAGIDVIRGFATVSPSTPSTGNSITFDIDNIGNGTDSVTVAEAISDGTVITVTSYQIDAGPTYANLAALNAALAATGIATGAGNGITITVTYDVPAGQGGKSTTYTLTATSRRDGTATDNDVTTINPGETFAVTVVETASGQDTVTDTHLPSNGTNYTVQFTVTNNGNGPEDYDLITSQNPGSAISVVSMTGTGVSQGGNPDSARVTNVASGGGSVVVTVTYSVADVAAGTVDSLFFLARSVDNPATNDEGALILTVIKPTLTITKQAWNAARSAQISGNVLPGDTIYYRVEVTNTGSADAQSVVVTDNLPTSYVTYVDYDDPDTSWDGGISQAAGTVTASRTTLAQGASDLFWIRVIIQ